MLKNNLTIGVTGAAGFIGCHLCEKLIRLGFKVIGIDNLSKGSKKNINDLLKNDKFSFNKVDVLDYNKIQKILSPAHVIVHLAAGKIPRYGNRLEILLTNTKGTENILEIAKKTRAKVVFASTSDVYGKNTILPFREDSDLVIGSSEVARWAYAVSKIFDEHLCFAYYEEYQVPFVILRLFGVFGPRQHRSWWGGPQSLFIDLILQKKEVGMHGDGKQTRTFTFIDDAVSAIIKSIKSQKANGQVINIGTKFEISILQFAKLIAKMLNKKLKVKKVPYNSFTGKRYEDVIKRVPDITKAKRILNWSPKTTLQSGLEQTIQWYINNPI